jgi:hypothetical protein
MAREAPTRLEIPVQTRDASVVPSTVDAAKRTVELVWSTGARVKRFSWQDWKPIEEELSLDPSAVDLRRLERGAPLLNAHQSYDVAAVMGVVERAWLAPGEARAVVRFSDREDVEPVWRDVQAGILRNVSVGYSVRKYEITKEEGKLDLYRAVDWEPTEISMVPMGADIGAGTRAQAAGGPPRALTLTPCEFTTRERPMDKDETKAETKGVDALTAAEREFLSHAYATLGASSPEKARGALDALAGARSDLEEERAAHAKTSKALEESRKQARAGRLDKLVQEGRLTPAKRAEADAWSEDRLDGYLDARVTLGPGARRADPPQAGELAPEEAPAQVVLTAEDKQLCRLLGVKEEDFKKTRAAELARAQGAR